MNNTNSKPRLKGADQKLRATTRAASSHEDWQKLMTAAIQLAERTTDPRLAGLREAMANGKTEQFLRRHHIICPADLAREFPISTT